MPPKKKKGGKKGKKKKDEAELELEEKYRDSLHTIETLRDQLVVRRDLTIQASAARDDLAQKAADAEKKIEEIKEDTQIVTSELVRQYKSMQAQSNLLIGQLETDLRSTKAALERTEAELQRTRTEMARAITERDARIEQLQTRMANMSVSYENLLFETIDKISEKLRDQRQGWQRAASTLQAREKQALLEFGLHPNYF